MGISTLPHRYRINGVVSTDKTVMQNLETLCGAAQAFLNYDIAQGKWAVVINRTGASTASFDDSNIVGSISIQGTGLRDLYNAVRVEFPHIDLNDEYDFVEIAIPAGDRNANEPDNTLNIQFDCINDPVMAEMLGLIELKQSRVDRVITFDVDFSYLGLKAGDLIDVTSALLGYTNKMFRIISINESDGTDGSLMLNITALEYDADVYDTTDLDRFARSNANGIVTIGQINPPTTPILTGFDLSPRPGVFITTTVPVGLVEGIEFWYSSNNVDFVLIGTERAVSGGVFTFGDTIFLDYDSLEAGDIYIKCRAFNSTTSSEFSTTASLIGFTPTQVTDAIGQNTAILDSGGAPIALGLAVPALLNALDSFMGGNSNGLSGVPKTTSVTSIGNTAVISSLNAMAANVDIVNGYDVAFAGNIQLSINANVTIGSNVSALIFDVKTPTVDETYQALDQGNVQTTFQIRAQPAFALGIYSGNNLATASFVGDSTIDWNTNYGRITVTNPTAGKYWLVMNLIPTYILNMNWPGRTCENNETVFYDFVAIGGNGSEVLIAASIE
jgi:hypothetical protein